MSEKRPSLLTRLLVMLKTHVAEFANRWCGKELLYWTDPAGWEAYMSVGEPYTPDEAARAR